MTTKKMVVVTGLTLALALSGCSPDASKEAKTGTTPKKIELRMEWWGSQARNDMTVKALKLFEEKHPNITVKPQFSSYDTYLDKLSTEIAGRNAPDLIQMDQAWMNEFSNRNVLLDLTPYVQDKTLNLDKVEKAGVQASTFNNKVYSTSMGFLSLGVIYDSTVFKELGIPEPQESWTWKEFSDIATKIAKAKGKGSYGALDITMVNPTTFNLDIFVRQNGHRLFDNGKLGATPEDLTGWFKMWDDLRKSGGATPPEVTTNVKQAIETRPITTGAAAMDFDTQNKLPLYQAAMKDKSHKLKIVPFPHMENEKKNGTYLRSSLQLAGNADTKYPKEVVMVMDFLLNDKDAAKILGADRGVPANSEIAELMRPTLTEPEQFGFDLIKTVAAKAGEADPSYPPGYPEFEKKLITTAETIAFSKNTIEEAVKQLETSANQILSKTK